MHIDSKATAVWKGGGQGGSGELDTRSGALKAQAYSANARFSEGQPGTTPEELIAAAHAGCYAMALAFLLEQHGHVPVELRASATVRLEKLSQGWTVVSSVLDLDANVPSIEAGELSRLAVEAKASCPVSRLLQADVGLKIRGEPAPGATTRDPARRKEWRSEA